jgi:pimeloyl-ACP methyl ester carboxylesterase
LLSTDIPCARYGPSELTANGVLKDWEGISTAHNINVPTLLINGSFDEVQDLSVEPWFNQIPKVRWVTLKESSHMGHLEERERFMDLIGVFLGVEKTGEDNMSGASK